MALANGKKAACTGKAMRPMYAFSEELHMIYAFPKARSRNRSLLVCMYACMQVPCLAEIG